MPEARRTRGHHTERLTSTIQKKPPPIKQYSFDVFGGGLFLFAVCACVRLADRARGGSGGLLQLNMRNSYDLAV